MDCLAAIGAEIELIEEVVVCPKLGLAGRLDRTVLIGGIRYICDIKTGENLSFSWGSIAMQLALYAGAETIYTPEKKTHRPLPQVEQAQALVIHLPAGKGKRRRIVVNLEAGKVWDSDGDRTVLEAHGTKYLATRDNTAAVRAARAAQVRDVPCRLVEESAPWCRASPTTGRPKCRRHCSTVATWGSSTPSWPVVTPSKDTGSCASTLPIRGEREHPRHRSWRPAVRPEPCSTAPGGEWGMRGGRLNLWVGDAYQHLSDCWAAMVVRESQRKTCAGSTCFMCKGRSGVTHSGIWSCPTCDTDNNRG